MISINAPAKVNLTLDVKGKRADNYHDIESVMLQISLMDRLIIKKIEKGIHIDSNNYLLPRGEDNLAYKAARLMKEKYNLLEGISIYIEKNIPIGAGLAGGSTDAAAVLKGVRRLFDLNIEREDLLEIGAKIGSDVPFCILGGTAIARGRGEILQEIFDKPHLEMLLVKPSYQVSTASVYQALNLNESIERPNLALFLEAWKKCDIINIVQNVCNVLETVTIKQHPEILEIKKSLENLGAKKALMSGSGPSVFAIFDTRAQAMHAYEKMTQEYEQVFLIQSYYGGVFDGGEETFTSKF